VHDKKASNHNKWLQALMEIFARRLLCMFASKHHYFQFS